MNDLIQKLESYNFVDELGHPLVNCVDWEELKERCKAVLLTECSICHRMEMCGNCSRELYDEFY